MIELFEEDYTLVKKGISIGTDVTSASSSTEGYTDGNLYINSDTLDIWLTDGQSWQLVGHIQGISDVTTQESLDDDGINTVTIIMTDGTSKTLNVKNGKTGAKGDTGVSIVDVVDNGDGSFYLIKSDGTQTKVVQTIKGDKGDTGDVGPRGYTGEKGRDVTAITMTGTGKSHPIYATYSDTTTQLIGVINDGNDGSGAGDMLKATYDVNDDGIVDKAETLTNGVETITVTSIKNKADKATSLAGYGIDDAYTKAEVDEMFDGVASDWTSVTGKPFSTVGTDFKTSGDKLALSENVTEKLAQIDEVKEEVENILSNNAEWLNTSRNLWNGTAHIGRGATGESVTSNRAMSDFIKIEGGQGTIKVHQTSNSIWIMVIAYKANGDYSDKVNLVNDITDNEAHTFTMPSGYEYVGLYMGNSSSISESDIKAIKCQVENGSVATDYNPYCGKSNAELTKELGNVPKFATIKYEVKSFATGANVFSPTQMPSDVPSNINKILALVPYSTYDKVFLQWEPQTQSPSDISAYSLNVLNQRGSTTPNFSISALLIYV